MPGKQSFVHPMTGDAMCTWHALDCGSGYATPVAFKLPDAVQGQPRITLQLRARVLRQGVLGIHVMGPWRRERHADA